MLLFTQIYSISKVKSIIFYQEHQPVGSRYLTGLFIFKAYSISLIVDCPIYPPGFMTNISSARSIFRRCMSSSISYLRCGVRGTGKNIVLQVEDPPAGGDEIPRAQRLGIMQFCPVPPLRKESEKECSIISLSVEPEIKQWQKNIYSEFLTWMNAGNKSTEKLN